MEVTQAGPRDAAIAPFPGSVGSQHEEPVDHGHDLRPCLLAPVDDLQVGEHPHEELALAHWNELLAGEVDGPSDGASHQIAARLAGEDGPSVERIEKDVFAAHARAGDE